MLERISENGSNVEAGLFRFSLALAVLALILSHRVSSESIAYVGIALAACFGISSILGWPRVSGMGLHVVIDALCAFLLVLGTGGTGSVMWPAFFIAAAGMVWTAGYTPIPGVCALMGGFVAVVYLSPGQSVSVEAVVLGGALLLFCGIAVVAGRTLRHRRLENKDLASTIAEERARRVNAEELTAEMSPLLEILSLDDILDWAADTARRLTGASYAHVAILEGNHHRTAAGDDYDSYPVWWHPEVQRLVLWSSRENKVRRSNENLRGVQGLVAVPLDSHDDERHGAIVVGGKDLAEAEERALKLLAGQVSSAVKKALQAQWGRDPVSRLPGYASLRRVIREEISRRGTITVVMAELDGMRKYRRAYGQSAANRLPREIGDRLSERQTLAFICGEDSFAVVLRGGSRERARRTALQFQNIVAKITAASTVPLSVVTGFTTTAPTGEDPDIVLDAARAAVEEARGRIRAGGSGEEPGYRAVEDLYAGWGDQIPGFVSALVEAAEIRVPALGAHMRTVSRLAGRIGAVMGLSSEERQALIVGGMLHDIGKIGLPDSIMFKSGPLTAEDYRVMKQHPMIGAKMLEGVTELSSAILAVKHHHERFDGHGYPDGLRGEEIPLVARVVFVADAFDSMVRGRPYRSGISAGDALREIDNNSGTQFDPRVTRALWQTLSQSSGRSDVAN